MAFTYQNLMNYTSMNSSSALALSAAGAIYANPTVYKTFIAEIEIHNSNNAVASFILYWVPQVSLVLGTPAVSGEMLRVSLNAYDTIWIEPTSPYILTLQNDAIFGVASLSGVNVQVRGNLQS